MLASPLRKEGANLPLTDSYKAVSPIWDHAHVMQYVLIHRRFALSQGDERTGSGREGGPVFPSVPILCLLLWPVFQTSSTGLRMYPTCTLA